MTEDAGSNNRRIARNAVMLYIRMGLSMIVGLYTSRVVLATLGVSDYGIYGVVGGIVGMMGFLNASMAGATSRFITFELGRGDEERLRKTFSSALIVHFGISLVILLLAETVGLWFLENKLVIPEGRMDAARWVYQLSILSAVISIPQAPYSAVLIAHEKMDIYAYFELLNVGLKLLIVYLLQIGDFDKLILYAVLTFAVSVFMIMLYRVYCIRHYSEARFRWIWDKTYLRPLLSFSGWDLFGNASVTTYQQGIAFVLNIFFGPVLNAANNIAVMVNGIIKGFASNVIQAFRPQIIKQYAEEDLRNMEKLVNFSSLASILMLFLVLVPIYFEGEYILGLWLVEVPDYSLYFLRIILISCVFNVANLILNIPIHATGNIKRLSLWTGVFYFLCPLLMYILLKLKFSIELSYSIIVPVFLTTLVVSLVIVKKQIPSFSIPPLLMTYGKCLLLFAVCSGIILGIHNFIGKSSLLRLLITLSLSTTTIIAFLLCNLSKTQRMMVLSKFKRR